MNEGTLRILILAIAAVLLAGLVGITINDVNYDNQRMSHGYCEGYVPGNVSRVLVKC